MPRHLATEHLIREVLHDHYIHLALTHLKIEEEIQSQSSTSLCTLNVTLAQNHNHPLTLTSEGVGFLDAGYEALMNHYAQHYPSLQTLQFSSFDVRGEMETAKKAGADAECKVCLVILNHDRVPFEFEAQGRSMAVVALNVVLQAIEYFINSELAFTNVYKALSDARQRGRQDLIDGYVAQLAELVKTTSYTQVIAQIKEEMNL